MLCAISVFADEYDGFRLARRGDGFPKGITFFQNTKYKQEHPILSIIGEQYCYLRMNHLLYNDTLLLCCLDSISINDTIRGWIYDDMLNYYHNNDEYLDVGLQVVKKSSFSNIPSQYKTNIYRNIGSIYQRKKNYAKAIEFYKKDVCENVSDPTTYYAEAFRIKQSTGNIYQCCKLSGDSTSWSSYKTFCENNDIEIDTIPENFTLTKFGVKSPNVDRTWIDRILFSFSNKSNRDSLAYMLTMSHISVFDKISICKRIISIDSINNNRINLAYDWDRLASLYNEDGDEKLEEFYLILASLEYKSNLSLLNVYEYKTLLVRLAYNAIRQKQYEKALNYEEEYARLFHDIYGLSEETYISFFHKIDEFHYFFLLGLDISEWSPVAFDFREHLLRKAQIHSFLGEYAESIHLIDMADSIMDLYSNWGPFQLNLLKCDVFPLLVKAQSYEGLCDSTMVYESMLKAYEKSVDFYWNVSVMPQKDMFGDFVAYTDFDRQLALKEYDGLRNMIYAYSYSHVSDYSMSSLCYNQALFEKQILLETSNIIKDLAVSTNNIHQAEIERLEKLKISKVDDYERDSLNNIVEKEKRYMIKELAPLIDSLQIKLICTYKDVRNNLSSNQVAIEYIVAPLNADSTMYCALLLRDTCSYPELVPLFEENEILSLVNTTTENQTSYTYSFEGNGKALRQLVWDKVLPHIKQGETIFFAPSGLFHQLAIEFLPYDETHTIADMFNLVRLSSTRKIVLNKSNDVHTTATLYGGIKYDMSGDEILVESEQYSTSNLLASRGIENDTLDRGSVKYLPGTKKEVESINKMLKDNKLSVQLFTTTNANEESFKALSGKHQNILHIATHGFYWSDSTAQKKDYFSQRMLMMDDKKSSLPTADPLNRCGLLFAGANTALSGHSADLPKGVQDGILTAKEISLLDLRDADLVVLSACETGKGEITGEGVFGLQRAFKQAGVQTIIMSLWPVNDVATQLLMTEFYRNWIYNRQSKREAFRNAQNKVRSQYEEPVYWAGFIMLD